MPLVNSETFTLQVVTAIGQTHDLTQVVEYTVAGAFPDPFDTFSVHLWDSDLGKLRKLTQPWLMVRIYIGGRLQCRGRIDRQEIHDDGSITISGRSYLAAMVDAHLDPNVVSKKGTPLDIAVLSATSMLGFARCRPNGFNEMRYIMTGYNFTQAPERDFTTYKIEYEKPTNDEGVSEYVDRITKRQGFLVQSTPYEGQITLARPEYRQPAIYQLFRSDQDAEKSGNNFSGTVSRDYSRVPTYMEGFSHTQRTGDKSRSFKGKVDVFNDTRFGSIPEANALAFGDNDHAALVITGRQTIANPDDVQPEELRRYAPVFFHDKKSKNENEADEYMARELAERTKDTLVCSYTVQGHRDPKSGYLWGYDTIARVDDKIGNVFENMWIEARTFTYSEGAGQTTQLRLIRPNSFII